MEIVDDDYTPIVVEERLPSREAVDQVFGYSQEVIGFKTWGPTGDDPPPPRIRKILNNQRVDEFQKAMGFDRKKHEKEKKEKEAAKNDEDREKDKIMLKVGKPSTYCY